MRVRVAARTKETSLCNPSPVDRSRKRTRRHPPRISEVQYDVAHRVHDPLHLRRRGASTRRSRTVCYDAYSRVTTVARPSGLTTRNVYTALGYLSQVKDDATGTAIDTIDAADAELHLSQETAGNGVASTATYDADTGRLTNLRAGASASVASFDYAWDTVGNLTTRSDNDQTVFEKYCYDALNRLTNSATASSAPAACTSTGTGITSKTVGYDALGDITAKSDVGTYSYPTAGSARPHAVSSITGTVNGVTNPSYTYDANGNLTAGAGRTVTPTSFNMVASVVQGTTALCFTYGDGHDRVEMDTRTSSCTGTLSNTTTYLNDPVSGAMSEKVVSGTTTTWHDYILVGGAIVAERNATTTYTAPLWGSGITWGAGSTSPFTWTAAPAATVTWSYFTTDHLGSASVLTDASGTVTERDSYDAWGRRRNPDGTDNSACSITSATTRGYTGHEMLDSLCEINANARIYDPTVARFMSPDSMVPDPFDGQSFNRYSYVGNNPLAYTDPSGDITDQSGEIRNICIQDCHNGNAAGLSGLVQIKDGTTGQIIGYCSGAAGCANLINANYSAISSISAGGEGASEGESAGASAGDGESGGAGGSVAGSTTFSGTVPSDIEIDIVTASRTSNGEITLAAEIPLDPNPPGTYWDDKENLENFDSLHSLSTNPVANEMAAQLRQANVQAQYLAMLKIAKPSSPDASLTNIGTGVVQFFNGSVTFLDRNGDAKMDLEIYRSSGGEVLYNFGVGSDYNAGWGRDSNLPPPARPGTQPGSW